MRFRDSFFWYSDRGSNPAEQIQFTYAIIHLFPKNYQLFLKNLCFFVKEVNGWLLAMYSPYGFIVWQLNAQRHYLFLKIDSMCSFQLNTP